jgi:pimeloyl-ACP methyl ester carboxylesterase
VDESHESLSTESEEYWDWTLDELGTLDFPCLIDYVLKQTNQTKLTYIGHSQGSAQAFIGLSQNPGLSDKIQLFIALAPAYFINKLPYVLNKKKKNNIENFSPISVLFSRSFRSVTGRCVS